MLPPCGTWSMLNSLANDAHFLNDFYESLTLHRTIVHCVLKPQIACCLLMSTKAELNNVSAIPDVMQVLGAMYI
eukprot:755525-Hanusia_phi.AAC.3